MQKNSFTTGHSVDSSLFDFQARLYASGIFFHLIMMIIICSPSVAAVSTGFLGDTP